MITLNEHFLDNMKQILGSDYESFLASLNEKNEKAIFINTNKLSVDSFLKCVDFKISSVPYEKNGFYVGQQKLGRHPLHHAGAFYIQEPSAMFTVNAYNFKGDETVLDLCSAPGGKSIQIANRIPNGILVSNEINKKRSEILFSNIERMGLKNVIITNDEPKNVSNAYANTFDVVLVDAPCSGEGMFRKGEDMVESWNPSLNQMCADRQLEILENANISLKQGGILIYSTCTYSKLENEDVVNTFISKHNYEFVKFTHCFATGINMPSAARLYPHIVKGEGQFVVVLKKKEENTELPTSRLKIQKHLKTENFLKSEFNLNVQAYEYKNYSYYISDLNMIKRNVNYVSLGVRLCDVSQKDISPFHNLFTAFGCEMKNVINLNHSDNLTQKYLRGETFDVDVCDGYGAVLINNCAVGGFKVSKGKLKNYYPKGLRNF